MFCKIVKGEIPADRVFENDSFIVIKDVSPKVEGHLLVIPKEHCDDFLSVPLEMYSDFLATVKNVVEKLGVKDFNLVVNTGEVAGQTVKHFHLHILPRCEGDGFRVGV